MNNEEAKFILQGYRSNGADSGDATFCAALEQAKNDPALGEWFAKQQAFDAAISAKLAQISPPADLRAAILAGGKVTAPQAGRAWWNRPVWMGAAAGIAIMLAAGVALWPNRAEALTDFVLQDVRVTATHEGHGHGSSVMQAAFSDPGIRLGQKIPLDFATLHETGCRTLYCQGHHVLEACFNRDGVWFHAYVVRRSDFPKDVGNALRITDHGSTSMATWADDEHVFVVVSKSGRKHLEALL